jgi:hypothetical protein
MCPAGSSALWVCHRQQEGLSAVINGAPFAIVAVTPPGFYGIRPGIARDVFLPHRTVLRRVVESGQVSESPVFTPESVFQPRRK